MGFEKELAEVVIYGFVALLLLIGLASVIPYIINLAIRKVFPVTYEIPWILLVISTCSIFLLILLVTFGAIHKMKKQNLIETIRMETM